MIICSYVFIDSFIGGKMFSLCFFVIVYWFIYCRKSFYLYDCFFLHIDLFIVGKTIENLRNKLMVDLVTSEEKLKKLASSRMTKTEK